MLDLAALYSEIIREHAAATHNRRALAAATSVTPGRNPSCGDEIELALRTERGLIKDAAFTGQGCAISQASVSLMIDLVRDKPLAEARALAELFLRMSRREPLSEAELDALEDAAALQSVADLPARVKCATMPWHTLLQAVEQAEQGGAQE